MPLIKSNIRSRSTKFIGAKGLDVRLSLALALSTIQVTVRFSSVKIPEGKELDFLHLSLSLALSSTILLDSIPILRENTLGMVRSLPPLTVHVRGLAAQRLFRVPPFPAAKAL
ncbi:hypothetical protein TNCV_1587731 [Trichonephila clavipes]|uniref:Uncharacterized protein n=1 Tax=Trichonephila clavipes TaxID=2585209 RepID=A0A8X6RE78_TRICX|nr:hypothetical protein TNCV_1587731 [Trichonephila clavipes]